MLKLKNGEIIPLTYDLMFTEIFNNEDNMCILEEFISFYFNIELKEVKGNLKLLSRNLKKENINSSKKEVDLLLDMKGKKYNIELSNGWTEGIIDRNIVYLSKIHREQLKRGGKYNKIEESIQINLNNFECGENIKTTYYLRNEKGIIMSKKFRIDVINLVKGKKMCYTTDETNLLIGWCKILTSTTMEELKDSLKGVISNKSKIKLVDNITRWSSDDNMLRFYTDDSKREMERESIMEEFKERTVKESKEIARKEVEEEIKKEVEEKIRKEKEEIANNMLKEKCDIEFISKITNLTNGEIKELNEKTA